MIESEPERALSHRFVHLYDCSKIEKFNLDEENVQKM